MHNAPITAGSGEVVSEFQTCGTFFKVCFEEYVIICKSLHIP